MKSALQRVALVSLLAMLSAGEGSAQGSRERVTLMIDEETCGEARRDIENALRRVHGVLAVDLASVPQHALVDIERDAVTSEDLIAAVRRSEAVTERCRPAVMTSCTTVDAASLGRK